MSDTGDIWQRYDAKVVQIRELEARLADLEKDLATARHERDHWARVGRQIGKKLQVARALAERLRAAQLQNGDGAVPRVEAPRGPAEFDVAASDGHGVRAEFDRAREVLGLVLTALTKALDDDDEAVAELGRRLRHHAGGKLLWSITRGALTLVPVDGRYLVDRQWLERLDLAALRSELDVAAQSGIYPMPEDASVVHTNPGFAQRAGAAQGALEPASRSDEALRPFGAEPAPVLPSPRAPTRVVVAQEVDLGDDLQVDLDADADSYADDAHDLPPPPPLPVGGFFAPPPLIAALPEEDPVTPSRPVTSSRIEDTVRQTRAPADPLSGVLIPNLRVGRLIKTPGSG